MHPRNKLPIPAGCLCGLLLTFAGCGPEPTRTVERPAGTLGNAYPSSRPTGTEGTIGSVVTVDGVRLLRVRGYGLVTGLAGKGSRRCPEGIREHIVHAIRKQRMAKPGRRDDPTEPTPEDMVASPDTAVVAVEGEIPAAAGVGRRFDLRVAAVDQDTQSLAGGTLLPTDLMLFRSVSPQAAITGKPLARAGGPVFINPFRDQQDAAVVNLREGHILGGGSVLEARTLRLVTLIESYATVRQVQDAINARFKAEPPTASAVSPSVLNLQVPAEFRGREGRFLESVLHLPLVSSATELEARARLLSGELAQPDAPQADLALNIEAVGKAAIAHLRPLYTAPNRAVNYYAARSGLRLGDDPAIEVIIRHAKDERSPFRYQAIRELGDCPRNRRAAQALRTLVGDGNLQIRVLAYEALRKVDRTGIAEFSVGTDTVRFTLEMMPSDSKPLIYVRRTQQPRIALIGGEQIACRPPLLYTEGPLTLTARGDEKMITVIKRERGGVLGPYRIPLSLNVLVRFMGDDLKTGTEGRLDGLGMPYDSVLSVLYRLCESGSVNADLRWEDPELDNLLGPLSPVGRPESEL